MPQDLAWQRALPRSWSGRSGKTRLCGVPGPSREDLYFSALAALGLKCTAASEIPGPSPRAVFPQDRYCKVAANKRQDMLGQVCWPPADL